MSGPARTLSAPSPPRPPGAGPEHRRDKAGGDGRPGAVASRGGGGFAAGPRPLPRGAPPPREVPGFEPLCPGRGARLRRAVVMRRRLLAASLAMAAAALAAAPCSDAGGTPPAASPGGPESGVPGDAEGSAAEGRAGDAEVLAPVRIADAGVAGLLKPGDVVDVLAVGGEDGGPARVVARAARVAEITGAAKAPHADRNTDATGAETTGAAGAPESIQAPDEAAAPGLPEGQWPSGAPGLTDGGDGALVVVAVPRSVAAALAGAAAGGRLAVTLR